jgi:hypothetical protein
MIPPWSISSGNNGKVMFHLERALELGPDIALNYIYAGEVYLALGKRKEANEILEKLAHWPVDPLHKIENQPMIVKATEFLTRL